MGYRPNKHKPPEGCRHAFKPVPVEVHDRLDGRPEIVAWLCPNCYEETHGPPPKGGLRFEPPEYDYVRM